MSKPLQQDDLPKLGPVLATEPQKLVAGQKGERNGRLKRLGLRVVVARDKAATDRVKAALAQQRFARTERFKAHAVWVRGKDKTRGRVDKSDRR